MMSFFGECWDPRSVAIEASSATAAKKEPKVEAEKSDSTAESTTAASKKDEPHFTRGANCSLLL